MREFNSLINTCGIDEYIVALEHFFNFFVALFVNIAENDFHFFRNRSTLRKRWQSNACYFVTHFDKLSCSFTALLN